MLNLLRVMLLLFFWELLLVVRHIKYQQMNGLQSWHLNLGLSFITSPIRIIEPTLVYLNLI
jgi:hypothetical protein